ncbi:MAG TPA: DUF420 domain-containing protein, partial [Tepidisphaeraceae bacterium]|nr:DUF420 domain-containing protein [Tepidisphaeraceae bacterium]
MPSNEALAILNACLNGLSTILLISAWVMIRRQSIRAHATLMISALLTSSLFLVFYLTRYFVYGNVSSGLSMGPLLIVYLLILVPHVILAIVMLPMIAMALWRAYRRDFVRHADLAEAHFAGN